MTRLKLFLASLILGSTCSLTIAQSKKDLDTRINILFGLTQPIVAKGFNIEGNFLFKRFAFDYSHGASLDFSGGSLPTEVKDQGLVIHVPYTTGFGVGYRFAEWISVRVEPKWHRWELYYNGEDQSTANRVIGYNTFSLGLGAYVNWRPFKNRDNALKGIMIAPSLRYWPTVSSTLDNNEFVYTNKITGREEVHERMQPGIANTPIVFNVSVGYSFKL